LRRIKITRDTFPDQRFTLVSILEEGASVVIAWTWAGSHKADIAGFAATGARITMFGLTIYDFDEENRMRGHWQIADRLGVFQQLAHNASRP
jgi:predicted ester cyclase